MGAHLSVLLATVEKQLTLHIPETPSQAFSQSWGRGGGLEWAASVTFLAGKDINNTVLTEPFVLLNIISNLEQFFFPLGVLRQGLNM